MCTETLEKQCLLASEYKRILLTYRAASSLDSVGNRFPEPPPAKGILVFKPGNNQQLLIGGEKKTNSSNFPEEEKTVSSYFAEKEVSCSYFAQNNSIVPKLHF